MEFPCWNSWICARPRRRWATRLGELAACSPAMAIPVSPRSCPGGQPRLHHCRNYFINANQAAAEQASGIALNHLAQDVLQDAAMAVIRNFFGRVHARNGRKGLRLSVVGLGMNGNDFFRR